MFKSKGHEVAASSLVSPWVSVAVSEPVPLGWETETSLVQGGCGLMFTHLSGQSTLWAWPVSREEAEVRRNHRPCERPVALAVPSQEGLLQMRSFDLDLQLGGSPRAKAPPSHSLVLCCSLSQVFHSRTFLITGP